jgi:hypothetical protein
MPESRGAGKPRGGFAPGDDDKGEHRCIGPHRARDRVEQQRRAEAAALMATIDREASDQRGGLCRP